MEDKNVFKQIVDGDITADVIYEDARCLALQDTAEHAPVHILVLPKKELLSLTAASDDDAALLGHLMLVVRDLARKFGIQDNCRVVTNCGVQGGQSIPYLHVHLLGGRTFVWPPG